ncbi:MAG: ABC transporter permease [Sediminibacterium sp.]|nr:ABC transporter permease [Sediminibacterium sp.]
MKENILIALHSIQSNKLRAIITMLIIAIGITALVGILSAIDAIKSGINSNFTDMGANTFTIRGSENAVRVGRKGKKQKQYPIIHYQEAVRFKEEFSAFPCKTSISALATFSGRIKYNGLKTNPNIQVFGADENYLQTAGYELSEGRNFSATEIKGVTPVTIIGKDVANALFGEKKSGLDHTITIGGAKYKVIGILAPKGNSSGFGGDKIALIPLLNARQYFARPDMGFTINVLALNGPSLDLLLYESKGVFRKIRKCALSEPDDFEIVKSDNLASLLIGNLQKVTMGATIIGFITLLGAAIGLMNIMLVSVTERTREIGIRKALGATQSTIKNQFLIESIVICVIGGILGIFLGIIIGNLISFGLGVGFFIPWFWIISGLILCVAVGLISGYLPAKRASKLDPIESLRFE